MSAPRKSALSQTLFLRLIENRWSESLERVLLDSPPGGVLLAEPLPRSVANVLDFIGRLRRACNGQIFIALREEGGVFDPLARYFPPLPSPLATATRGGKAVEKLGDLMGKTLRLLGVNTNFALLLDLATPLSENKIATRSFGSDPRVVTEYGGAFLQGLAHHKVLACGKHFPGLGSVPPGKGSDFPVSAKPMAALWKEDLMPFRSLLSKLPMVLLSSAAYKAYDFEFPRPACLSSFVVEGLLREKLGYSGLAIGFDLEQQAVHGTLGFAGAVVEAVSAGCDMVIVDQGAGFSTALKALENGANNGRLASGRTNEALARVRAAQKRIPTGGQKASPKSFAALRDEFQKFAKSIVNEALGDA